jgi:hypothetical protein
MSASLRGVRVGKQRLSQRRGTALTLYSLPESGDAVHDDFLSFPVRDVAFADKRG